MRRNESGTAHRDRREARADISIRGRGRTQADRQAGGNAGDLRGHDEGHRSAVIPREGFELDTIRSGGLKGKSLMDSLRAPRSSRSDCSMRGAFSRRQPHLVIGVGGCSSGPVVLAAALRGVPTLLLEQNAVPALTNPVAGARRAPQQVSCEIDHDAFSGQGIRGRNPVRTEFLVRADAPGAGIRTSRGRAGARVRWLAGRTHAINVAMVDAASHAGVLTGEAGTHARQANAISMRSALATQRRACQQRSNHFSSTWDVVCRLPISVVCRAGATTLAELAAAGKPAVLFRCRRPLTIISGRTPKKCARRCCQLLLQADANGAALAARIGRWRAMKSSPSHGTRSTRARTP